MYQAAAKHKIERSDFFWLAYLVFFFIEPISRKSPLLWVETLVSVAIFVGLYTKFLQGGTQQFRVLLLVLMYLLGALNFPHNGGAVAFFIYVAALLPFGVCSAPWVIAGLVLDALLMSGQAYLLHANLYGWMSTTFFIVVVGGTNIFFAQKERADRKLHMAQEEIEALAAVAERERIARDLHDVLGHTLSVIVLKAELAGRLLDAGSEMSAARARTEIGDVERAARTALTEVREAIGGYRSKGLLAEIEAARRTLEAAGVALDSDAVAAKTAGLSASEETVLALALREAVTNIVRHAQATECTLRFVSDHGHRRLVVEDNGPNTVLHEGNGLRGMRERVEALGGHMELDRGRGTRLQIELPLTPQGAAS